MALVYFLSRAYSVHHRQRCSEIRQLDRTDRRTARSPHLPRTIRLHVALHELDDGTGGATFAMVAYGLLERVCDCRWMFHHDWWHVWCGGWAD